MSQNLSSVTVVIGALRVKAPVVPCCSPLLAIILLMFSHRLLLPSLYFGYLFCGVMHSVFSSYNHLLKQERSGYFASLCSCFPVAVIILRLLLAVCGLVYNFWLWHFLVKRTCFRKYLWLEVWTTENAQVKTSRAIPYLTVWAFSSDELKPNYLFSIFVAWHNISYWLHNLDKISYLTTCGETLSQTVNNNIIAFFLFP